VIVHATMARADGEISIEIGIPALCKMPAFSKQF
jgi:hypothetical protein